MRSDPSVRCPGCLHVGGATLLWDLPQVPVQSCRLLRSAEQARRFASGALTLYRCDRCGLVYNRAFDPRTQQLDADYEEIQSCSAHFNAFAAGLARQLIGRYGLSGKRILEVGCGKGSFLAGLCALADAAGLGVDPSYDPRRRPCPEGNGVHFESAQVQRRHRQFGADLLLCRHTLEHIHQPVPFLRLLAEVAARAPLVVEVPDLQRILDEGAFWDLYYEHCVYFSEAALVSAAAAAGLQVAGIERVFDDQYLLAHLRVGETNGPVPQVAAGSGEALRLALARWQQRLAQWAGRGERAVLWGAGSKGVAFLSTTAAGADVVPALVDINPHKQGRFLPHSARPVLAPEQLVELAPDHVVVMNPAYLDEVGEACAELRLSAAVISVNQPVAS